MERQTQSAWVQEAGAEGGMPRRRGGSPWLLTRGVLVVALALLSLGVVAQGPTPKLRSLRAVHDLDSAQAGAGLAVEFEATVGYDQPGTYTMYVQEGGQGLYVRPPEMTVFAEGDVVAVRGLTRAGVHPYVQASSIELVRHGAAPRPVPATLEDLLNQRLDGLVVAVRARILTADEERENGHRIVRMRVQVDSDRLTVRVDADAQNRLKDLIDAEVRIVGVSASRFTDQMRQSAAFLRVATADDITVLKPAAVDPWSLKVASLNEVMKSYRVKYLTERVHVRGRATYYRPGGAAVLQNGDQSLWVGTLSETPIQMGEMVDAIGFPDLAHGVLTLVNAELKPMGDAQAQRPLATTWPQLTSERHLYDLVSIEGEVVSVSRGAAQDDYILRAGGATFSAMLRHGESGGRIPELKLLAAGSLVRVTGICYVDNNKPFDRQQAFGILMRSADDIEQLQGPSWFNAQHLVALVGLLSMVLIIAALWGWVMARRVHEKSQALAKRIEADAAFERRMTQLEARRSRILEDINGAASLASILEEITELVSLHLDGAPCWCEIRDGARLGKCPDDLRCYRVSSLVIPGRIGAPSGMLYAGFAPDSQTTRGELEGLAVGVRVATLAIETRRVYSDLRHRSEFDLLTDVPNRFLLQRNLEKLIEEARQEAHIFGLIYIDLDGFKQINDACGHQVGDRYLQEAAARMKRQLRGHDMLARIGGDEFAALVSAVRSRGEVDEIAQRLERCLDNEIAIGNCILRGSVSVGIAMYPEDAATIDGLLTAADAAMYVAKNMRRSQEEGSEARVKPMIERCQS